MSFIIIVVIATTMLMIGVVMFTGYLVQRDIKEFEEWEKKINDM